MELLMKELNMTNFDLSYDHLIYLKNKEKRKKLWKFGFIPFIAITLSIFYYKFY